MSQRAPKRKEALPELLAAWTIAFAVASLCVPFDAAADGAPSARCVASCERHVLERPLRTQICGRCLLLGDQRAGWLDVLGDQQPFPETIVRSAMGDDDWAISQAAMRVYAKHSAQPVEAVAATWLVSAKKDSAARACEAIYRTGAASRRTFAAWRAQLGKAGGRDGARAARLLKDCEPSARAALELQIYGMDARAQLEAVRHLAVLEGTTPALAVLDAMGSRPPETDGIAAAALRADAQNGGAPLGLSLLRAASAGNQDRVNRLVAIYADDVRAIAQRRLNVDPLARKGVVSELRAYGPLATPELEAMLTDEDVSVRSAAARAIVEGEGTDFETAVRARVRPPVGAKTRALPPEQQARWIELYAVSGEKPCAKPLVREVAQDESADDAVRAAALKALAMCPGGEAQAVVLRALRSDSVKVRAAGVAALEEAPRTAEVKAAAAKALGDPAPEVKTAALTVIAAQRQSGLTQEIAALIAHPDAKVRAAAVRALGTLAASAHVNAVADRLQKDPDRDVRIAAVGALGEMGGAVAVGALSEAAAKDSESRVRYLADQRLKAMGFHR